MVRILLFALVLASCSSEQTPFCKCVESGKTLSDYSAKLFNKEVSSDDEVVMTELRAEKDKDCKAFENLADDKIQALKEECEE